MIASEIIPGRIYEARVPMPCYGRGKTRLPTPLLNDRVVLWVNSTRTRVQWDGPACKSQGGKPEVIDMRRFLLWAGRDITAIMPEGEWREWSVNSESKLTNELL